MYMTATTMVPMQSFRSLLAADGFAGVEGFEPWGEGAGHLVGSGWLGFSAVGCCVDVGVGHVCSSAFRAGDVDKP